MSVPIPAMRVPDRVLELEARFHNQLTLPGRAADALLFGQALGDATASHPTEGVDLDGLAAELQELTASVRPVSVGAVVNDDGTLADDVPYADLFRSAGAEHGIAPSVLAAVAKTESAFDPQAVSHAGALGLMQFMPATAAEMGVDPLDPASAIDGAARYLSQNLRRFGSLPLALAAYNAGPGAVANHGGIPPYAETQAYVPKVLSAAGLDPTTGARLS